MPAPTSLRTNIAQGSTGWFSDTNVVHATLNALTKQSYREFDVREYAAVGDGVTDDTAAFTAAAAAMIAQGSGTLRVPPGTYRVTQLPTFSPPSSSVPLPYAVVGDGSSVSIINLRGTSSAAALTVTQPNFDPSAVTSAASSGAPIWSGFTLDGTGSSGGCNGIQFGDVNNILFQDVRCRNFSTGDGFLFFNGFGWTEGVNMIACTSEFNLRQVHFDVGSGAQIGAVTTTIASGSNPTTIAVAGGLTKAVTSGQTLVLAASVSAIGVVVQDVITTAAASIGATSVSVTLSGTSNATALTAYTAGTAKLYNGSYGSFDYFTINSLYLQASANQDGWVSEASRGLNQTIQRVGASHRITGNFRGAATNTGTMFVINGNDQYSDCHWDWACEVGGGPAVHKSVAVNSTSGVINGWGRFSAYQFGAATFTGGVYQFGVTGMVHVNGIGTGQDLNDVCVPMMLPMKRNVNRGVQPTGGNAYPTSITSGAAYQNTTGRDVLVTVPLTATGAMTAGWNTEVYSGMPTPATLVALPSGSKIPLQFVHYASMWARVDVANGTIGTPIARFV